MKIPKKIKDDIWEYCRLNDISDVEGFTKKMLKQGLTVEKYGTLGDNVVVKEVEKIVEKIVEKPVEVIKEVEKIIEKEVYVSDDESIKELTNKIGILEGDLNLSNKSIDTISKESIDRNKSISELKNKIKELEEELESEKSKPKVDEKDIYGEGKRGIFGSNLSNLWNRKKQ